MSLSAEKPMLKNLSRAHNDAKLLRALILAVLLTALAAHLLADHLFADHPAALRSIRGWQYGV